MDKAWQTGTRGGRFYITKTGEKKYGKEAEEAAHAEGMKGFVAPTRPDPALIKLAAARKGLNVPRAEMPQIRSHDVTEFLNTLRAKGIKVEEKQQTAGSLKPTQRELNPEKVAALKGIPTTRDKPIIVSKDGFIMDGHHRWAGIVADNPNHKIATHTVDLPMKELLKEGHAFPKAMKQSAEETGPTGTKEGLETAKAAGAFSAPIHPGPGPVLSPAQAEEFAKGSKFTQAFFRGTTHPDEGAFIPTTSTTMSQGGRGVYMLEREDKDPNDDSFGAEQEIRVNVENPINAYGKEGKEIKDSPEYNLILRTPDGYIGGGPQQRAAAFQTIAQRKGYDAVYYDVVEPISQEEKERSIKENLSIPWERPTGRIALTVWDARKVAVVDRGGPKRGIVKQNPKPRKWGKSDED